MFTTIVAGVDGRSGGRDALELARRFADRIVGMSGGRVVYDGPPQHLSDDVLKQIYGGEGWLN